MQILSPRYWRGRIARGYARFADEYNRSGFKVALSAAPQLLRPHIRSLWVRQQLARAGRWIFPAEHRKGVLFIGYAEGNLGIGQCFRNDILAAADADLPFAVYPFNVGIETRLIGPFMHERYDKTHAYDVNVIEVAPDQVPTVLLWVDSRLTHDTYNVLRTYWELPNAPKVWRGMLEDIDEIWVPNGFVGEAVRQVFAGPITIIPPMVDVGDVPPKGRKDFGMEAARFYFLFSFDYFSSPYRKNPLGVVEAFQSAFPNGNENVGLIIHCIGQVDRYPEINRTIRQASVADSRILIIDGSLSHDDMLGLIHSADVYVSFHRSEGLGMGMAEAMAFGRIVIGTNFSGNTDFLTEQTGFPVPYTLRPVKPHEYPWAESQVWAEPDLKAAALILQQVFDAPDVARKRATEGQTLIRERYGISRVGRAMKERLVTLGHLDT